MGQPPVKPDVPIGHRLYQIQLQPIWSHRRIPWVGRFAGDRQQAAAAAVQKEHRRDSGVDLPTTIQRQPFVSIAMEVHLDIRGAHPRQPPFRTRETTPRPDAQSADGFFDHIRKRPIESEPERRLVGAVKPLFTQRDDRAAQPLEQRGWQRPILQMNQRLLHFGKSKSRCLERFLRPVRGGAFPSAPTPSEPRR